MNPRRSHALGWAVSAIITGLVWRLAPLHLPPFAYKYGGSVLYAAMLYWLVVAAFPRARVPAIAATALDAVGGAILGALGGAAVNAVSKKHGADVSLKSGDEIEVHLDRPVTLGGAAY